MPESCQQAKLSHIFWFRTAQIGEMKRDQRTQPAQACAVTQYCIVGCIKRELNCGSSIMATDQEQIMLSFVNCYFIRNSHQGMTLALVVQVPKTCKDASIGRKAQAAAQAADSAAGQHRQQV